MAQRLLLVALCAVIAVQLISSVEGASKGCIKRCNTGCRKGNKNLMECLRTCYRTYPKSCQKCKKNDNRCYGCLPGFMLSNAKCIPCATGCICDQTSTCLDCRSGYVKTPNGCAVCNPGCDCDSTGKCTCKSGYVASATYDPTKPTTTGPQCLACPANCADCSSTGPTECFTCKPGYTLIDGVCKACISGCLDCTSGVATCDTCKPGYQKTSSTACTACPANCASCKLLNTTYCDVCMEGYGLTRNRKGCVACAPNCKRCDWDGYNSCDSPQCVAGKGYDATAKTCSLSCSTQNCDSCYPDAATCVKCAAGFTLSSTGSCDVTGCDASVSNCAKCTSASNTICEICISGFGLASDGTCKSCTTVDSNCLSCTVVGGAAYACTSCPANYLPGVDLSQASGSTPKCWACQFGCKDCTAANMDPTTGNCRNCFTGFVPGATAGTCTSTTLTCDTHCAPPYCAVQQAAQGNNKCDLNCIEGYMLDSTFACQPCQTDSKCKHCQLAGQNYCDGPQCKDGYTWTADNKCKAN